MASRSCRALLVAACATALSACDGPTEPVAVPPVQNALLGMHDAPGCVAGAVGVEISVYPQTIPVGGTATPYKSAYDTKRAHITSNGVELRIEDTTIVHVTGTDADLRPVLTGRRPGKTRIIGTCGPLEGSKELTVTGTEATDSSVIVTLATQSVAPGQTTQALAHAARDSSHALPAESVSWTTSNEAVATISSTGLLTAKSVGTVTVTATVGDAKGSTVLGVTATGDAAIAPATTSPGGIATAPALPRATPSVGPMPAAAREIRVPAGGDLQAALDGAQLGDAILLAPGASYVGNFVLRNKGGANGCGAWITIRTETTLPPAGQRVTPSTASQFAKIFTPNVAPAIQTEPRASCYRLTALEIAIPPSLTAFNYGLVALGDGGWVGGGEKQISLDLAPSNLVLDRLYIHGQATSNFSRCIALNSANTAIVDSWISDCHAKGFDSQAIEGWNGPGPYLIENNFLAGAGENVMFGGADPGISGLSPSDITIRRNHVYKDPSWKGVWTVKNLFELKNARRVLVEGNVFENSWADAQSGMAIVIKSTTDSCGTGCMWEGTTDVTLRYNIVRNANRGLNVQAYDNSYVPTGTDVHVQRVRAEHNLFENIGQSNGTTGDGWLALLTHDLTDVALVHNTFVGNLANAGIAVVMDYGGGATRRLQLENNVFAGQQEYAVFYSGTQVGTKSLQAMASDSWSFAGNIVTNVGRDLVAQHPAASWYPATTAEVGFAGAASGDYRLGAASAYRGKATDGRDPGADLDAVRQRTAGVVVR